LSGQGSTAAPIGLMGGTFDPVHFGHLRAALEVRAACELGEMRLLPAATPPHRTAPLAPASLRLAMLRSAVGDAAALVVDDRELRRGGPSYTVDTLAGLRHELPHTPLCLVLGADAFLGLDRWHRWQEIFSLAHLIVIPRPGTPLALNGPVGEELRQRRSSRAALRNPAGGAIVEQAITPLGISASAIRALVASGGDPRYLVPDPVRELLLASGCYGKAGQQAATAAGTEV